MSGRDIEELNKLINRVSELEKTAEYFTKEMGVTEQLVQNWNKWDIVREVIQNALDEHDIIGINKHVLILSESNIHVVADYGRGLSADSLNYGVTEKRKHSDRPLRGIYGTGLKRSAIVACREGIKMKIITKEFAFEPVLGLSNADKRLGSKTRTLMWRITQDITTEGSPFGTVVILVGNMPEFQEIYSKVIGVKNSKYTNYDGDINAGYVISDTDGNLPPGKLFRYDLYVCDMPSIFSYNVWLSYPDEIITAHGGDPLLASDSRNNYIHNRLLDALSYLWHEILSHVAYPYTYKKEHERAEKIFIELLNRTSAVYGIAHPTLPMPKENIIEYQIPSLLSVALKPISEVIREWAYSRMVEKLGKEKANEEIKKIFIYTNDEDGIKAINLGYIAILLPPMIIHLFRDTSPENTVIPTDYHIMGKAGGYDIKPYKPSDDEKLIVDRMVDAISSISKIIEKAERGRLAEFKTLYPKLYSEIEVISGDAYTTDIYHIGGIYLRDRKEIWLDCELLRNKIKLLSTYLHELIHHNYRLGDSTVDFEVVLTELLPLIMVILSKYKPEYMKELMDELDKILG